MSLHDTLTSIQIRSSAFVGEGNTGPSGGPLLEDCEEGYHLVEEIGFHVSFSLQLSPVIFDN
jgi:hypothetical protein